MAASPDDRETESIRVRLLKVLRLAQQGVGGERENAEALLEKLLRRHGMSMADLEPASGQSRTVAWLPAAGEDERNVLAQLVVKMFGTDRTTWQQRETFNVGVEVTHSEHAALVIAWDAYRAAFAEARQALVLGFCFKHGLYAAEGASSSDMSAEAQARASRAIAMADTLPEVDPPSRRLPSSDDNDASGAR